MGLEALTGGELKKHIKLAKKQKLAFAWSPGKSVDDVLLLDKRKTGKFLSKTARVLSGNQKVSFGDAEVKGKLMTLTCEKELPQLAKTMKRFMRSQKLTLNILVLDEDGNELDSDIEDLPDDPEMDDEDDNVVETAEPAAAAPAQDTNDAPAQSADEAVDPRDKNLRERLMAMQPPIREADDRYADPLKRMYALAAGHLKGTDYDACEDIVNKMEKAVANLPPPTPKAAIDPKYLAKRVKASGAEIPNVDEKYRKKLEQALKSIVKMIKGKEFSKALTGLDTLDKQLKKLGHAPQEVPKEDANGTPAESETPQTEAVAQEASKQAEEWGVVQGELYKRIETLITEKKGDLAAINRVFGFAQEQANAGNYAKALAAAQKAVELVTAGEKMLDTAAADEAANAVPEGVVHFSQQRIAWGKTRDGLKTQIAALKSAIESATSGVEGLDDVSSKTPNLFAYLNSIDDSLETALDDIVQSPEGTERDQLKSKARNIIDAYRNVLDEPFFKAVDNNGFTSTNIRASALTSLQNVSAALEV